MDCKHVAENHIAELYIQRKLSPEQRAEFEEHFLECLQCVERVEMASSLRDSLRYATPPRRTTYLAAIAAGIVALVLIPSILLNQRRPASPEITPVFRMESTRDGNSAPIPRLAVSPTASNVVLSIERDWEPEPKEFRVSLLDPKSSILWRGPLQGPADGAAVGVEIPVRLLSTGVYRLAVEGKVFPNQWFTVAIYPFEIILR